VKNRAFIAVLAFLPLLAGCNAVPMTYSEWQAEQRRREIEEKAGIKFKSKGDILKEAAEARKAAGETTFP